MPAQHSIYSINSEKQELMRQQLIISVILAVVFITALLIKLLYFPKLSGQNAYYFLSIFWICGVLIAIFLLNIIWYLLTGHRISKKSRKSTISWPNRRKNYRIIYPNFIRPTLVVERADNFAKRQLEYPVVDLSQEGICFLDDGSLGTIDIFSGHIRFNHGDKLTVSGKVLRRKENHVSVQLHHAIDWSMILKEQRRLMSYLKPQK
jgi:hypothetical protein